MGRKAIMTKIIGIFKGKQAAHNKAILQTRNLFSNCYLKMDTLSLSLSPSLLRPLTWRCSLSIVHGEVHIRQVGKEQPLGSIQHPVGHGGSHAAGIRHASYPLDLSTLQPLRRQINNISHRCRGTGNPGHAPVA